MELRRFLTAKPAWTIFALTAIILLTEASIMVILGDEHGLTWANSLRIVAYDAGTLTTILVPFIYLVLIKPVRLLEERYRMLLESVPDGILHLDRNGKILFVNNRMEELANLKRAELLGQDYLAIIAPPARPRMQQAFAKLRDGQRLEGEPSTMTANGREQIFVEFSAVPWIDQDSFQGAVGIVRDVSETKRVEANLFRAQQDWEAAFDSLTDMITVHDNNYTIIQANKAARTILRLPSLEGNEAKCFKYFHGMESPPEACLGCQTQLSGLTTRQETFEPHLGKFLETRVIPRLDREGRIIGLIHVVRDITAQKAAEAALRESELQYRRLFESNPSPMWVYDAETLDFLAVNEAALSHYGFTREEFRRLTIKDIRPEEDVPALVEKIHAPDRGPGRASGVRHRKKDGTIIFVDVTSYPLAFSGRSARIVLANDVSEQKKLEDQLRHSQKMEAVGQLAGGVAHDFNNLLAVIVMYASLLRDEAINDESSRGYVDKILATAERAANLTRSLLTFSRKRAAARLQPADLNEIIQSTTKLLLRLLGESIEIRVHVRNQRLVVMADAGQLEQVIMNLCTNARDAMPDGGILTLESALQEIDGDFIAAHGFGRSGAYAVFSVADTGTGMDDATRLRIFEPFFTTKEIGKGTGLGLAIVYGIVKQHEGFINVRSQAGAGTTFEIYLPLIAREAAVPEDQVRPAPPRGTELVLLAEDEEEVRRITRVVLEANGYRVIEAVDGEDAVRKFHESKDRVNLLLSDMIMPKRNGKDAYAEMLRADPGLKALFTSGYTADVLEQQTGLDDTGSVLSKPASPSAILHRVREVLDGT